jgi:hypothetical protein
MHVKNPATPPPVILPRHINIIGLYLYKKYLLNIDLAVMRIRIISNIIVRFIGFN